MTSEQDLKQKIQVLDPELEQYKKEILEFWETYQGDEKHLNKRIENAAQTLENRYIEKNQPDSIATICVTVKDWFRDEALHRHIERVLDERFKRKYNRTTVNASDVAFGECAIKAKRFVSHLEDLKQQDFYRFDRGGVQDIAQLLHVVKSKIELWAEKDAHIPLPYQHKELPGDRKPAIRLNPADIPRDEQLRLAQNDSYRRWAATRKAVENRMTSIGEVKIIDGQLKSTGYNFVSDNLQTEHNNIFRKDATDLLERPLNDKKWQRDWGDWADILENYHDQGGTYASSKSAVDTTIIDKKTGKPEKRKITKEQIDAKHDPYLNAMCFMVRQLKPNNKILGNAGRRDMDKIGYYMTQPDPESGKESERFIKIEKFKLTKEQLKPNYESFNPLVRSIIDEFRQLIKNNPDIEDLYIRFREKERAHRAARSVDLHDVLSEAA